MGLVFYYGVMGSSKSANLLMTKFNYEEKGMNVLLIKPVCDNRDLVDDQIVVRARIGIFSKCTTFGGDVDLLELFSMANNKNKIDIVMVDECQMATEQHIEQLKIISKNIPVLCYGLKTTFKTKLFEASKRLIEIADQLIEIESICQCGSKATNNVRFVNGIPTTQGDDIAIEGQNNITYQAMCYHCYFDMVNKK